MRNRSFHWTWCGAKAMSIALCALFAGACNLRHELVAPQIPNIIDEGQTAGPTGANGLRVGALP